MNECLVAVAFGDYRFTSRDVADAAARTWVGTSFVPPAGPMAGVSAGQLQVQFGEPEESELLAGFLPEGQGISLDGTIETMAQFIEWLSGRPGFPDDGSIVVLGWTRDEYPVRPEVTAEQLIEQFDA